MHRYRGVIIYGSMVLLTGVSLARPASAAAQTDHCLAQCVELDTTPSLLTWNNAGTDLTLRWIWSKEEGWVLSGLTTGPEIVRYELPDRWTRQRMETPPTLQPKPARGGVRAVRFLPHCQASGVGPKLGLIYEDGTASWHRLHLTAGIWEEEPLAGACPMAFGGGGRT